MQRPRVTPRQALATVATLLLLAAALALQLRPRPDHRLTRRQLDLRQSALVLQDTGIHDGIDPDYPEGPPDVHDAGPDAVYLARFILADPRYAHLRLNAVVLLGHHGDATDLAPLVAYLEHGEHFPHPWAPAGCVSALARMAERQVPGAREQLLAMAATTWWAERPAIYGGRHYRYASFHAQTYCRELAGHAIHQAWSLQLPGFEDAQDAWLLQLDRPRQRDDQVAYWTTYHLPAWDLPPLPDRPIRPLSRRDRDALRALETRHGAGADALLRDAALAARD